MEYFTSCLNNPKTCPSVLLQTSSFDLYSYPAWCGPDKLSQAVLGYLQRHEAVRWMHKLWNIDPIPPLKSPTSKIWISFENMKSAVTLKSKIPGIRGREPKEPLICGTSFTQEKGDTDWAVEIPARKFAKAHFHPVLHMQKCYTIYLLGWWLGDTLAWTIMEMNASILGIHIPAVTLRKLLRT